MKEKVFGVLIFGNDPYDDYNLIVEILYNEKDVAIIRKIDGQLILQWYAKDSNLEVPVDWFLGLLEEAKVRLSYE